jgi:hypothetical protein
MDQSEGGREARPKFKMYEPDTVIAGGAVGNNFLAQSRKVAKEALETG